MEIHKQWEGATLWPFLQKSQMGERCGICTEGSVTPLRKLVMGDLGHTASDIIKACEAVVTLGFVHA